MQRQTCAATRLSCTETEDVVEDVADQIAPPDDEREDRGQRGSQSAEILCQRPAPRHPVSRQQSEANGNEMLLEVEETEGPEMSVALELRPDVNTEIKINDSTQKGRDQIE